MTKTVGHNKFSKSWVFIISGILALFFSIWWVIDIYVPYGKKRESLRTQIIKLEQEIGQKDEKWRNYRKAEERLGSSMNSIREIRSKLPDLKNLEKIVLHLKATGLEHDLIVEEEVPEPYLSLSPYPSESLIHPVNLTLILKGDFGAVGKFIQFLDEENRQFCHIRSVNMERSASQTYTVSALIKMEMFFQKQEGKNHDAL
ncbi:MAG: type 4a pilus biogenesis protein PilO [bacterium]